METPASANSSSKNLAMESVQQPVVEVFPATDENGVTTGTVKVNDEGTSYGYSPFLVRRGADADDILFITFRLAGGGASLRLIDDEELEAISPST